MRSDGIRPPASEVFSPLIAPIVFLIALAIYWFSANQLGRSSTPVDAYFDHLADAFLQGRTYLVGTTWMDDLTLYRGRWYVAFSPLVAMLLLPWVAVSGVDGVNTVLFAATMGAINVVLAFSVLQRLTRRGWSRLATADNIWLTALWGIGSIHWYLSTLGSVWFLSQIATATFVLAAVNLALDERSPLLWASALGVAMWARPHIVLTYPLLLGIAVGRGNKLGSVDARTWVKPLLFSAVRLVASACALLWYNYVRFDDPFDSGYATQNVARNLVKIFADTASSVSTTCGAISG